MDARYYESYRRLQDHHWWFRARSFILLDLIRTWGLVPAGGKVLDIGCGPGGPLLRELERQYSVAGIDSEPEAVASAHEQGMTHVRLGTAQTEAAAGAVVELALLLDVIEHVEDDVGLLRAAWEMIQPGGCVLVSVPALMWLWSGHDRLAHHHRRYGRRELVTRIEQAGFQCERVSYFNTFLFPLAAVKKLADRFRKASAEFGYYDTPGRVLNRVFYEVFKAEARWLRTSTFPIGVSLLALGRKQPAHVRQGAGEGRA